ncbi:MAG TPA: EAL domain-containing protein, partial [Casimicrobiaceae bacterium]
RAQAAQATMAEALREREAGLRHAQGMAKLAHVVTRPDGSFESWSETLAQLLGVENEQVPKSTRDWLQIVHPTDRPKFRAIALATRASGARSDIEYRLRRADGAWIQIRQAIEPIPGFVDANGHMRWFGILQDVTEQMRAETNIRRLNRVYAMLSGINTLIVRVADRDELYRETCRIAVEAGGFQMAWLGVVDRSVACVKPLAWNGTDAGYLKILRLGIDESRAEGAGVVGQAVRERKPMIVQDVMTDPRIVRKEHAREWGLQSLVILPILIAEEVVAVLALHAAEVGFFDAQEMKLLAELAGDIGFALDHIAKAEQLDYLAFYDPLTGLPNRTLFNERLSQHLAQATRDKSPLAVVLFDIERFHTINETLGRQACDDLLKQIGARCSNLTSDPKLTARLGGNQFATILTDVKSEDNVARLLEQRNREVFGPSYRAGDIDVAIAVKYGIAVFPGDAETAESLLKNAESALNRAKSTGDRYLFYTQQMSERVAGHLTLENKLRHALEKDEFVLHYQPKVDIESRRIVGVEALMRWQSADLGLVQPLDFIPLLEETGMILEVGAWALRQAVSDHQRWVSQNLAAPRVAVNVSPIQLRHRDFIDIVRDALRTNGDSPAVGIEITESVIMEDIDATVAKLRAIRDMGLNIAIDDFGTGYSSLSYLAKLPVHSLKIDRTFIIAMADDPDTLMLVSTIVSLAHSLRLKVVAEGVETEDQAKILGLLRCDRMQGYLISKPVPESELQEILRRTSP